MKTLTKLITTTVFFLFMALIVNAQTSMDYTILVEDIEFQPGVTIDINVNVYVNENAINWADHGKIFAIEGMIHTANCWLPFAEELFVNSPQGVDINEFFAIDMPGRGGSGLPEGGGFLLDQMYLADYIIVISAVLDHLNNELGVYPNTIMGHSMGGMEVFLLQNKLINEGSNLRQEFGIKNAILLAPGIPAPLDWAFLTNGGSTSLLPYAEYIPGLGIVLNVPYYVWPYVFFTNRCCYFAPDMVPGAPFPGEVLANGYCSIEPGPLLFELSGMIPPPPYPYKPRISADPELFTPNHGVQLTIIADEHDRMMYPEEEEALYVYLTNDNKLKRFFVVEGDETCHDTHISDPYAIVELLNTPGIFKNSAVVENTEIQQDFNIFPNPVGNEVSVSYAVNQDEQVTITLYNSCGSKIEVLKNEFQQPGSYHFKHNIEQLPDGVYFITLKTGNTVSTKKVIKIN